MDAVFSRGLGLFLLLCFSGPLAAQMYHASTRSIGQSEGLSHHRILAFYPDSAGMWIGTQDGLNFFDGYNWQYWTKDDGHFSHSPVNFLLKDQAGYLWVFHTQWVEKKNDVLSIDLIPPARDSVFALHQKPGAPLPFPLADIQTFFGDAHNRLYFMTKEQLWCYTPTAQFHPLALPPGFTPRHVLPDGTFAGELQDQLTLVAPTGEVLAHLDYPLDKRAFQLLGDREQFWVWQAPKPCKVFQRQDSSEAYTAQLFPARQASSAPFSLLCYNEQEKELWINNGDTIHLLDQQGKPRFQIPGATRRVSLDKNGNYWLGKYKVDVLRLQKRQFSTYLHNDQVLTSDDNQYQCRGIYEKDGQLIVGTYEGVRQIQIQDGHVSKLQLPTRDEKYFAILEDRKGQRWLGYNDLVRLSPSGQAIAMQYSFERGRIWSLFEDQNGLLWVGSEQGLSYLKDGKVDVFDQYNGFEELKGALVLFFYKDQAGTIWVGSNEGLYQLDREKGITAAYGKRQSEAFHLPARKFQHMHQDAAGIYWLATEDAGLIRWDKKTEAIKRYDQDWGMLTNNIYSVYEDDFGFLWMSSFNGLIRFNKQSEALEFFHQQDGICYDEFNRISHFRAADGRLYFGSQNGITAFHPRDFLKNPTHEVEFELSVGRVAVIGQHVRREAWADGSPIDLEALPADTRTIDIQLQASNLFWAGKVALHSTLERLGDTPSITSRENISYSNHIELFELLPGTYQLKVRAIQENGKQLGESLEVPIHIHTPIYLTTAFWLIVGVLLFFTLWGGRQWWSTRLVPPKAKEGEPGQLIESMQKLLDQRDEEWLRQFQSIIDQRLDDPSLYLPDIIQDMNISRTAFYQKVKSLTNMTPNQYIQELRLTKAKAILDRGQATTVKEVAYAVGMKEPKYFSKRFKERFGVLPSTYFRHLRN